MWVVLEINIEKAPDFKFVFSKTFYWEVTQVAKNLFGRAASEWASWVRFSLTSETAFSFSEIER
jgi:hypothetical protein